MYTQTHALFAHKQECNNIDGVLHSFSHFATLNSIVSL